MDTNNTQPRPNKKMGKPKFSFGWFYVALIFILFGGALFSGNMGGKEVPFSQFEQYLQKGYVESVTVFTNSKRTEFHIIKDSVKNIVAEPKGTPDETIYFTTIPSVDEFSKFIDKAKAEYNYSGVIQYKEDKDYFSVFLYSVLPFLLLIAFFVFMNRKMMGGGSGGGGIFSVGKSQAKLFDKSTASKVTFRDVAGLAGAKQEVEEIVSFLKNPKKYTQLGGKIPKGALLVGPPGTGKTLLAKAVAGEADVPFFSMSGSDFVEMFVGVGASRVRDLFRQAKEKAPCIIFIDEIDAIGRARGKSINMSGNDERENTLNQLLTEMDGFGSNSGVIILAATNRAEILDKALLRAGRFDRQIHVELPDIQERKEIFNVHLRPIKIDESVDVNFLAKQTPGFSGADIANVCNEAALIAARNNKTSVGKQDFMDAVDRIVGGLEKKTKIMTEEEKRSIAFHEAGHATISWMLQYANPLVKVTIVPRGEALGAAWYLPEERQLTNYEHLIDEMCATLGGRAAEELFLNQTSTGAINDLERVTKRAYAMVAYFGMSPKLANMSYYDSSGQSDYGFTKPYSEQTAELIDAEAKRIISEQFERALSILKENEAGHHKLAELLIEKEVIMSDDLVAIFGERKWKSRQDELIEANEKANEQKGNEEDGEASELPEGTKALPEEQKTTEQPSSETEKDN